LPRNTPEINLLLPATMFSPKVSFGVNIRIYGIFSVNAGGSPLIIRVAQ
jgi:hypothetical protein